MPLDSPIPRSSPLSKSDRAWMNRPVKPGAMVSRGTYVALVASAVRSKTGSGKSVVDEYVRSDKGLWDGEPKDIVVAAKKAFPDLFQGHYSCGDLVKEKALVGRVLNELFADGQPLHAKPNLRS